MLTCSLLQLQANLQNNRKPTATENQSQHKEITPQSETDLKKAELEIVNFLQKRNKVYKKSTLKTFKNRGADKKEKKDKADKKPKEKLHLNSVGLLVKESMLVTKKPFQISRCDQIVAMPFEAILDHDDYTKRTPVFLTFTAYHLNMFEKNHASKLMKSILLTNSRNPPFEPLGAQYCLQIDGGDYETSMIICGKVKTDYDEVNALISSFEDCRLGAGVTIQGEARKAPPPSMPDFIKECGWDGPLITPEELLKQQKKEENQAKQVLASDNKFWVPGGSKVPGSR